MKLSIRSQGIPDSPTLALAAKAIQLKSQGVDVISLSVGEPDWSTLDPCVAAGQVAIKEGKTRYTPASGIKEIKEVLSERYNERYGFNSNTKNFIVTPGAKYGIQEALWCLVNPGDKVGVFSPYWPSYTTMIEIADGSPVTMDLNQDFSLNEDSLKQGLDQGVEVLMINSPNNPSGAILEKPDYEILAKSLESYPHVRLILDDIYQSLYWGKEKRCPHLFDHYPELFERSLVIDGASKAFAMTGWRLGWAFGDEQLISSMGKLQSQTTGCPSSIAQWATLAGLKESDNELLGLSQKLKERADTAIEQLVVRDDFKVMSPEGAFYLWVDARAFLSKVGLSDQEFGARLLEKKAVVIVPGSNFGQEGFFRMSFAVKPEVLKEGISRIFEFCEELA